MVLKKQKSKIQKRLNKLKQKGGEATSMTPVMPPISSMTPEMMRASIPSMPPMPSMSPDMMAMMKASMGPPMTGGYRKKSSRKSKQNKSTKNKSQKKSKNLTKKNRKH